MTPPSKMIDGRHHPRLPDLFSVAENPFGAVPVIAHERHGRVTLALCGADSQFPLLNFLQGGCHIGTRLDQPVSIGFVDLLLGVEAAVQLLDLIPADTDQKSEGILCPAHGLHRPDKVLFFRGKLDIDPQKLHIGGPAHLYEEVRILMLSFQGRYGFFLRLLAKP